MGDCHSSYIWGLGGRRDAPPIEDLRIEDLSRPTVGDLIKPGQLVATNYGTGPYKILTVTAYPSYHGSRTWSLVMHRVHDGFVRPREGESFINEIVVEWDGDTPRFRMLFACNDDEVLLLDGAAYRTNKAGQLSLF